MNENHFQHKIKLKLECVTSKLSSLNEYVVDEIV